MNCRNCNKVSNYLFLDLGFAPPSNAYRTKIDLNKPEINYPLRVVVCDSCWLVQTEDFVDADELFTKDYAYFSSTSISWLEHAKKYSKMIQEKLNAVNTISILLTICGRINHGFRKSIQEFNLS